MLFIIKSNDYFYFLRNKINEFGYVLIKDLKKPVKCLHHTIKK